MKFNKLIPNIFYTDIKVGLHLFVDVLGFTIGYEQQTPQPFYVVNRDGLTAHLIEDKEFAEKDRPELRLVTDDIRTVYNTIKAKAPDLLHPNLKAVTLRPWGAQEFALRDASDVCIIIQQW